MKKFACLGLSMVMALGLMTGCGNSNGTTGSTTEDESATGSTSSAGSTTSQGTATTGGNLTGTVNTAGSTSMKDVVAVLTECFAEIEPGVTINYTGSGSGAGVEGALTGTCDIGLASRALNDEEKANIEIGTVDAFQGKEFDYVLLSCVRSNAPRDGKQPVVGFLEKPNRLCVAFSRSIRQLAVYGDAETLIQIPCFSRLYNICAVEGGGCYREC